MSDEDRKGAPDEAPSTPTPAEGAPKPAAGATPGPNVHQAKNRTLMLSREEMQKQAAAPTGGAQDPARASESGAPPRADDRVLVVQKDKPDGATTAQMLPAVDPTGSVRVRYFGRTDVGLVREHNEDNFIVADLESRLRGVEGETPREAVAKGLGTLLAVCDGMGGAAAGEVASQMAVDTLYETLTAWEPTTDRDVFARRLVRAVEDAGHRIFSAAKVDRSRRGMGTTATVAGLMDKVLFVGQVGDSRAYLKRGDKVTLITKDQSLVNQLIEAGQLTEEEAEDFEHSNIILQALGTTEEVQVDLTFLELRKGDRLMLCSDGLSGLVHQEMIADVLKNTASLPECTKKLIELANAGGGHDNITVICADFDGHGLTEPSADTPAMYQQYPLPAEETDATTPPRAAKAKVSAPKLDDLTPPSVSAIIAGGGAALEEGRAGVRRLGGPVIVVVLVLAIGAIAGGLIVLKVQKGMYLPSPIRGLLELDIARVPVQVESNVEGELYVDGVPSGALSGSGTTAAEARLGLRVFEARSGGIVLVRAEQVIAKGQPNVVVLNLAERAAADAGVLGVDAAVVPAAAKPADAERAAPAAPEATPAAKPAEPPAVAKPDAAAAAAPRPAPAPKPAQTTVTPAAAQPSKAPEAPGATAPADTPAP